MEIAGFRIFSVLGGRPSRRSVDAVIGLKTLMT